MELTNLKFRYDEITKKVVDQNCNFVAMESTTIKNMTIKDQNYFVIIISGYTEFDMISTMARDDVICRS